MKMKKILLAIMCATFLLPVGIQNVQGTTLRQNIVKENAPLETKKVMAPSGCTAKELQNILNENMDGKYNLTVEIPSGTYQFDHTIYVWPNTTIHAASGAKIIKMSGYGAMIEDVIIEDKGSYDTSSNITIDGGIWDSTPTMTAKEGTESFRFIHCSDITVKNLTVCNVPSGSHLVVFAGVRNAQVSNCKFYGYGVNGDGVGSPKEAVQLDVVHSAKEVPTNQSSRIKWDDTPCDQITISDCEFYNYSRGIGSHTAVAGRPHTNVTIKNNSFHDLTDSAVRLYNYKDTIVSGNKISNSVAGILAYTYIEAADGKSYFQPNDGNVGTLPSNYNILLKNNTIQDIHLSQGNWGDGIRVIGSNSRPMTGVKIEGNTISNAQRYGIFGTYAPKMLIQKANKISLTAKQAILLEKASNNSKISGCVINNKKMDAIAVYGCKKVTVSGNTVTAKDNGIRVALNSPMAVVEKNTVQSAGQNGIWVSSGCGQSVVRENTIKKYGTSGEYYGIYIYQAGGKSAKQTTTVKGNTITGSGKSQVKHGIKVSESPYLVCEANKITATPGNGIYIYKSKKSVISKNVIKNPKKSGIWVSASANSSVVSNVIKGVSNKDAIKIVDSAKTKTQKNKVQ